MSRIRPGSVHGAILGLTHPHSGKLAQTLENLPEVGRISLWENAPGAAQHESIPRCTKVGLVSSNVDEVLAQADLDFAVVCVTTDIAAELALKVIRAGKHLLAEKPAGLTSVEIRSVQRAADKARVRASVMYIQRAHPALTHARALVGGGKLGALLSVEARMITTQVQFRDPGSWLFKRSQTGGGIMTWLGCHFLDLIHFITGDDIKAVSASYAHRNPERIDVEDTAAVILQLRSGAIGTFNAGYALAHSGSGYLNSGGNDAYLAFNARGGRVVWPSITQPKLHIEGAGRPIVRDVEFALPPSSSYGGSRGDTVFRAFIKGFRNGSPPPNTLADALRTAYIIEACQKSAATKRQVKVQTVK